MPQPAFDTHAEVGKLKQAGCPEKQAEAMVDLVSRAPVNASIARTLDQMQHRLESIESALATKAAKADLEALRADMIERIESLRGSTHTSIEELRGSTKASIDALRESTKASIEELRGSTKASIDALRGSTKASIDALRESTKADIAELRGSTKASIESLRAQMARMLWVQGLALATLIISLAGIMISLAGSG